MRMLLNISRIITNQSMKFVQLIQYNTKNVNLEKSYTIYGRGSSPRPFSKIKVEQIFGLTV